MQLWTKQSLFRSVRTYANPAGYVTNKQADVAWHACKVTLQYRPELRIDELLEVGNVDQDEFPGWIVKMAFGIFPTQRLELEDENSRFQQVHSV